MNERSEFPVGSMVEVREEYRSNPSLNGLFKGEIVSKGLVGTVLVYCVNLEGSYRTISHGALKAR